MSRGRIKNKEEEVEVGSNMHKRNKNEKLRRKEEKKAEIQKEKKQ